MLKHSLILLVSSFVSAVVLAETNPPAIADQPVAGETGVMETAPLGEAVEKHLPTDVDYLKWIQDPETYKKDAGDKIEIQKVLDKEVKTVKLQKVIPPIRFESGKADIPERYIDLLREVLDSMRDRKNVRVHFVGHTDDVQLVGLAKEKYGDNVGLSRERAGVVAEYIQRALNLPPESVSYEGVGESQPVATNTTPDGRAQNRRVEVEVWYDEIGDKLVDKEVVVSEKINRVKVCRVETVCKLRYKEGHSKRVRIKNLIPPLHFDDDTTAISDEFLQQIKQAMHNLEGKQNVVIKIIGFTDNLPLEGRAARIYGNHVGLSKARARRAVLAVQDALKLPNTAIDSDGKGAAMPIASNDTEKGRALNRRIEVEFWHDDALQELPDEPQLCPEAAGAETVTRVYDPPWGSIKPILFENGKPVIPAGYSENLRRAMDDIRAKTNVRLRFIGYTNDERLDRRTAMVYGDDIGLSAARARRAMEAVKQQLGLPDERAEHEGRGYVQSDDVVNSGFVQSDTSRVEVQVVYDELAALDDTEGLEITRLTREVEAKDPFAVNLMRITVDGKPTDDPAKSIPDVQRCTDVALEKANIQFKFDNLELKPRLNVTAWPNTIRYQDKEDTEYPENLVRFRIYSNYPSFIEKSEIRVFERDQSTRATPLAVIEVNKDGYAEWQPSFDKYEAPGRELKYLLRVYDKDNNFDETDPQAIWVVDELKSDPQDYDADKELLAGYSENHVSVQNIPLKGGVVKAYGSSIPSEHSVWVAGRHVPVDHEGRFVVEEILPPGMHTVEVAVLDKSGNGDLYLRDLELEKNDWFYVGIADVTAAMDNTHGPAELVTNDKTHYDNDLNVDGRFAFFTRGKFGDGWGLTASADTREGPLKDIFSNFTDKSPDALFRRIDPDYFYPTYGDDGVVEETAPTLGKFYVKLQKNENYGLWGNFKIGYTDNDLAHVDRGLYGANLHYQSLGATTFGEERFMFDSFVAEPGTIAGRDEFRGTDGSLYFLRHQDILTGSERARIEIRDKDTDLVLSVKNLTPGIDYDIDYLQGRIVLAEPLPATVNDNLLVKSDGMSGNRAFLVVRYEFTPGFDSIDTLTAGGRTHFWLNDYVRLGITANSTEEAENDSSLNAADLILRKSAESWIKFEMSNSEGPGLTSLASNDGGFTFGTIDPLTGPDTSANAYRVETSVGFKDFIDNANGSLTLFAQTLEAGFSAPGLLTAKDTEQYGGTLKVPLSEKFSMNAKAAKKTQDQGLETSAEELDVDYQLNDHWTLSTGVRHDSRKDFSPIVPLTQEEGERSDAVARAAYDSKGSWGAYGFVQDTLSATGNREENGRVGVGGAYRVTDRFKLNGEISEGDLGPGGKFGTEYLYSDRTNFYLNYGLEDERTDNGVRSRQWNRTAGVKTRYSDSASVYLEQIYTHGDLPTSLTHATGISYAPTDRLNLGARFSFGTMNDELTGAETKRNALGLLAGYSFETIKIASALEYREDETENPVDASTSERTTWLIRNSLKYQITPDWRLVGKFNHSESNSSLGEFYDGGYTEAVVGYGYRPVSNDRLNALVKYTYFYNMPTVGQVTLANTAAEFIQKSHIAALDVSYDVTRRWTLGGKYAYRLGQASQDRVNQVFFDNRAHLYIVRADWHFIHYWDALIEARMLDMPDAQDRRAGALLAVYRNLGNNIKLGVGYNFTDFSDDLTDLSYDSQGVFVNLIGKL